MIRIGILGNIGSGKSYVAKNFGYPVFNADDEVSKLYKSNKAMFEKLNNELPKYLKSFPVKKNEIIEAILSNKNNLKKIIEIVHKEIRNNLNFFLKKNKDKKIVILDIPLLLENKINKKNDILVFVDSKKSLVEKKLKKRENFNLKIYNKFKKIQFSSLYKKKKSNYIIINNFREKNVKKEIKNILNKIL
tara:strand:- start:591 stop:1160 length:570 start_codon:yes stop_codon:yes gene_type:complete